MNQRLAVEFIKNLHVDIWSGSNISKLGNYYHADYVGDVDGRTIYYQDLVNYAQFECKNSTNVSFNFFDIVYSENKIAVHLSSSRLHKGQPHQYKSFLIFHLADDKIIRAFATFYPKIEVGEVNNEAFV